MSSIEVAEATSTHQPTLRRILRALAAIGIVAEAEPDRFSLTPLGSPLRKDVPGSMRTLILLLIEQGWRAWGDVLHSVRTGEPAFQHVHGMTVFDWYKQNLRHSEMFNLAMASGSGRTASAVVEAYDFSRHAVVVDVGGGTGTLIAQVLAANPNCKGILFDLPHVVSSSARTFDAPKVAARCQVLAGSFFESVPSGGSLYMMSRVIHDWDDERAARILANCRQAMAPESGLILIEYVLPELADAALSPYAFLLDLEMLINSPGGRERSENEFRSLLERSGFDLQRVIPTIAGPAIIEARPVSKSTHITAGR